MDIYEIIKEMNAHISVLNDDYTKLSIDVAVLKNQIASMVWWTRTIVGSFIVLLITQIWQLILIKKNGKK